MVISLFSFSTSDRKIRRRLARALMEDARGSADGGEAG
jgi:hypothetical protein